MAPNNWAGDQSGEVSTAIRPGPLTTPTNTARAGGGGAGGGGAGGGGAGGGGAGQTTETDALSAAIEVIAAFVADFEPGLYSGDDAATLVSRFCRAERLCGAGKTLAAARVAESNRPERSGHKSAADWLASVTGQPVGQAVEELRLGEALAEQPGLDAAYRGGRLSRLGAALVAGATAINPSRGHELVEQAEHDSWRQLRDRCLRVRAEGQSAEEAARRTAAIHRARRCRTWTDVDGSFRLDATLTAEAGAALTASLTKESARFFERARREGVHESRDAYTADALVALVTGRGIIGAGPRSDTPVAAGDSTIPTEPSGKRRAPDPKAIVHLRVDLDALRRGETGTGEICEIPGVGPVSIETARNLMGDALVDLVIANGVDVTTICHLGRSIPTALRTALVERDRSCVVPGCDVAQGLEIDHWGISFSDGGPASLANLARLCSHHHYLRTHQGFRLSGGPGRWVWEPPPSPRTPSRRTRVRPRVTVRSKADIRPTITVRIVVGGRRTRMNRAGGRRRPRRNSGEVDDLRLPLSVTGL